MNQLFHPSKLIVLCSVAAAAVQAGTFSTDFNSGLPAGTAVYGNAIVDSIGGVGNSGVLKLTTNVPSELGSFVINDLDPGQRVLSFTANFKVAIYTTNSIAPSDGFSFNFATDLPNSTFNEDGGGSGITISFDTYNNVSDDNPEGPEFRLKFGGNVVANRKVNNFFQTGANFVPVQIIYTSAGTISLTYNCVTIFTNIFVTGALGTGARFGFGARSGTGGTENHFIDDLSINTTTVSRFYVKGNVLPFPSVGITPDSVFQVSLQDSGASVNTNSIGMTFDGLAVTPSVSKSSGVTTITWQPSTLLLSNSLNHAVVTFSDSSGPTINTLQYDFTVASAPIWSLSVSNRPYLLQDPNAVSSTGSTPLWRSIAYNPFSNHVYIVTRTNQTAGNANPSGLAIWVLDADTGADLFQLQTNGIPGDNTPAGNFPLINLAVSDDGSIYGANVVSTANSSTSPLRIYRWASGNSSVTPVQVYAGDPGASIGLSAKRWGDTLAVRGSGTNTQIILDCNSTFATAIVSPTDAFLTNFTSTAYTHGYTGTGAPIGRSLQFGPTNTYFLKKTAASSQPLDLIRYDASPSTTILLSGADYHLRVAELAVDLSKNLAVGIYTNSPAVPDRLLVFDISNFNAPVQIARYDFPITHKPNINAIGQVLIANGRIFAIDGNNGILVVPELPPVMPRLDVSVSGSTAVLSFSNTIPPFSAQASPDISPASWSPLTQVSVIGGKSYVTNNGGARQFYRLIKP